MKTTICRILQTVVLLAVAGVFTGCTEIPKNYKCPDGTKIHYEWDHFSLFGGPLTIEAKLINQQDGKLIRSVPISLGERGEKKGLLELLKDLCPDGQSAGRTPRTTNETRDVSDGVWGDFNGDNIPDFATSNRGTDNIAVWLALTPETDAERVLYPCGPAPVALRAADVDGDGVLDLITANEGRGDPGSLSLLRGQDDGSFGEAEPIAADGVYDVATGDFNGDGHLDLAYTVYRNNEDAVVVRLGTGGGAFSNELLLPVSGGGARLVVASVNPKVDSHPDIVTSNAILLGNGDGTFQASVAFTAGAYLVEVGDLDGDGQPDLVAANNNNNTLMVRLGHGDGTFGPPDYYVTGHADQILFVDLDADGDTDLLVSQPSDFGLPRFYFNQGGGRLDGLAALPAVADLWRSFGADDVAVADVTGDGVPDLLVANGAANASWLTVVLPGLGGDRFGPRQEIPGFAASRLITGDWNGDGVADVAAGGQLNSLQPQQFLVALGVAGGGFGEVTRLPLPGTNAADGRTNALLSADFNGDGFADVAITSPSLHAVSVLRGDGAGGFTLQPPTPAGPSPNDLVAADFDGDGKVDLAVTCGGDLGAVNGSIVLLRGLGDGAFGPPVVLRENVEPDSLATADFNGDGHPDLAVTLQVARFDWDVEIYLGDGEGGFQPPRALGLTDDLIRHVFTGDADRDGQPDLGCTIGGQAVLFRGLGNGSFVEAGRGSHGGGRVRVADFDLDGWPDLVSASGQGYAVVLRNPLTPDLVRPSLSVRLDAAGKVAVAWPEVFPDWTLTESATLRPPWQPTAREVTANGGQLEVVIDPAAAASGFFRLESADSSP